SCWRPDWRTWALHRARPALRPARSARPPPAAVAWAERLQDAAAERHRGQPVVERSAATAAEWSDAPSVAAGFAADSAAAKSDCPRGSLDDVDRSFRSPQHV